MFIQFIHHFGDEEAKKLGDMPTVTKLVLDGANKS